MAVSLLALGVWLVNFYGILSWLQPLLFGGRWIVEQIPWWVAALTHLVFGWTMLIVYPLGRYTPYRLRVRESMIDVQTARPDVPRHAATGRRANRRGLFPVCAWAISPCQCSRAF